MLVRQYIPEFSGVEESDLLLGRVIFPQEALRISWVRQMGGKHIWEPDEEGHGLVISYDGLIVAELVLERAERPYEE